METIEEKVKGYNPEALAELDKERRDAAHSGKALEYTIYCDALCITPEDQFKELYERGLLEKHTHAITAHKLEFHLDKKMYVEARHPGEEMLKEKVPAEEYIEVAHGLNKISKTPTDYNTNGLPAPKRKKGELKPLSKNQKKFLTNSCLYSSNPLEQIDEKKRELRMRHRIFQRGEKRDIDKSENPGGVYNHVRESYVKRLEQHEPQNPMLKRLHEIVDAYTK